MAVLGKAFDSGQHSDMNDGFDPIPAGEYLTQVVESDVLATKTNDGKYIKLKFKILQGEFKGRFIWTNLNIINKNPVTVEIAQKELATLCRAIGKAVIQDTQQLHGIPFKMKVKIKPAKGDFPAGNEPINYFPAGLVGQTKSAPEETKEQIGSESTGSPINDDDVPWGD